MNECEIFETAIEIGNENARQLYIERACGEDKVLLERVKTLLDAHTDANSNQFLQETPIEKLNEISREASDHTIISNTDTPGGDPTFELDLSFLGKSDNPDALGKLGHYQIMELLGHGGFGIVFKAFDEKLHRLVAIKAMLPELAATSPPRKRFLREARSAAAIRHENVVQVYSVEEEPIPYLVMEFIDGETLEQRLRQNGPLDINDVLDIAQQVANGLQEAHKHGLIHRDVKPANILVENGPAGKVKLMDFGLARAADDASLTQSGVIAGSPMYMSPEQAKSLDLDARTDLFSLGSVIYEMSCGRPPFRASDIIAVLRRVADDTPTSMRRVLSDIPMNLNNIVKKLHEKDPGQRFQSAKEVADALKKCQECLTAGVPVIDESQQLATNVRNVNSGGKGLFGKALGIVAVFGILLTVALNQQYLTYSWNKDIVSSSMIKIKSSDQRKQEVKTKQEPISGQEVKTKQPGWFGWPAEAPAPATAPFNAEQAQSYQQAWADYLELPVEKNIHLGNLSNGINMEFVLIPPGEFLMGSSDEEINRSIKTNPTDSVKEFFLSESPQHIVVITKPFYLSIHEVTQQQYQVVTGKNPSSYSSSGKNAVSMGELNTDLHPVEMVSWNDCVLFCNQVSQKIKRQNAYAADAGTYRSLNNDGVRLPTEAEWEYAARAGTTTSFYCDEEQIHQYAWVHSNSNDISLVKHHTPHPVGSLLANAFGLYDMHGNIQEWCQDIMDLKYYTVNAPGVVVDPQGPTSSSLENGIFRPQRGGPFTDNYRLSRSGTRMGTDYNSRNSISGFRVALPIIDKRQQWSPSIDNLENSEAESHK